ncbi:hypothetical protein ACSVIJ_05055 [Pseudomonas sp. NCHU5208]|uniref:hypothetical protein n=1 Tax=unclassified Pseudomonas TaxID=196821 RepID=UPI003F94DECD
MSKHPEAGIAKFQWASLAVGLILLALGLLFTIQENAGIGAAVSVGSLGWLALGLVLSPQVRKDLFGDRFERSDTQVD